MADETDERGSTIPLLITFTAVLLLLVAAVVDSGAAYLGHQQVDALADGAALRGADAAAEGDTTYEHGVGHGPLTLTAQKAERAVLAYLRDVGAAGDHPGIHASVRVDHGRVVVVLTAPVALPLHLPGAPMRASVRSTGSAAVLPD
ncbi:hypothetical protein GCM10028801_36260 [Nocardioides maradonensis]